MTAVPLSLQNAVSLTTSRIKLSNLLRVLCSNTTECRSPSGRGEVTLCFTSAMLGAQTQLKLMDSDSQMFNFQCYDVNCWAITALLLLLNFPIHANSKNAQNYLGVHVFMHVIKCIYFSFSFFFIILCSLHLLQVSSIYHLLLHCATLCCTRTNSPQYLDFFNALESYIVFKNINKHRKQQQNFLEKKQEEAREQRVNWM